jgi:hypothetical protein
MADSTIVTKEMLADVTARLRDLDQVEREIGLAKRAGFDVAAAQTQAAELRQKLVAIRTTYGPGSI